jgi:hypothetical protein
MKPNEGQFDGPKYHLDKSRPEWGFFSRYEAERKRELTTRKLFDDNPTVAELEKRAKAAEDSNFAERKGLHEGTFEISGDALARAKAAQPPKDKPAFNLRMD